MDILYLYLLTRIDSFRDLVDFGLFVSGFLSFVMAFVFVMGAVHGEPFPAFLDDNKKKLAVVFCALLFFKIALPSKSDVLFIAGGTVLLDAVRSPDAKRLSGKSVKAVENWLDKQTQTKDTK